MRYRSANLYFKETFGEKVYKISLDAGMTCPNRDGSKGRGGCIFCSESGSGDFAVNSCNNINNQIEQGISLVKHKNTSGKYIAYFQSYTNTYAPVDLLENLFTQAIKHKSIVGLSIATRPDCLGNDVLNLLEKLNQQKPVMVELGLQTIHKKTAEFINRCYNLSEFDTAIYNLNNIGIHTVVHVILGLPNESKKMMLETVEYTGKSGANGIKLQLLHVLKESKLADYYNKEFFKTLSMEEYISLLAECISILPKDMVVHRLTGDGAKKSLIAPLWSSNKKMVLNSINNYFNENNIIQGSKYKETIPDYIS